MCICNGEKILNLQSYLRIIVLSEFTSDTLLKTLTIDALINMCMTNLRYVSVVVIYLMFGILSFSNMFCHAEKASAKMSFDLRSKQSVDLIIQGAEYIKADTLNDMAVAVLTEVVNRYYENQTDSAARKAATKALNHLGNLYMTHEIDYRKAYKCLVSAQQIAEEDEDLYNLAHIYNGLANLYYYNAQGKSDMHKLAFDFMNRAADAAMESHNDTMLPYLVQNMAIITYEDGSWGPFQETIKKVMAYKPQNPAIERDNDWQRMNFVLRGVEAMYGRSFERAEQYLTAALGKLGERMYVERNYFTINYILIHLYDVTGQLEKATSLTKHLIDKAVEGNLVDFELSMYAELANLYEKRGMADSVDMYYNKYLHLKDYFEEHRGYNKIETLDLRSEMERINKEVEELSVIRQKEKRERLILAFALVIVAVVCIFILIFYFNFRKTHRKMFRKNEDMTKFESMHRLMREQWDAERRELLKKIEDLTQGKMDKETPEGENQLAEAPSDSIVDSASDYSEAEGCDMEQTVKLFSRIIDFMESSREIYKPKFSLSDLSSMLGVTPRSVSRAINICYHANFHQLLNDYRIREVSRIMHDEGSENLTIESLAEQGGFRSRTYFATIFKKGTGLTPSEYLKMAKKDKDLNIIEKR